MEGAYSIVQASARTCAACRFEILADSSRGECMELDFCPHLYPDAWPFVLMPVVSS
jgi:hypothetical protein